MKKRLKKFRMFFHIHIFRFKFTTGHNRYYECRCGKREVFTPEGGYQPIANNWINHSNEPELKPIV